MPRNARKIFCNTINSNLWNIYWNDLMRSQASNFGAFLLLMSFIFKWRNGFSFETLFIIPSAYRKPNFNLEYISLNLFIFLKFLVIFYVFFSIPTIYVTTNNTKVYFLNLKFEFIDFHAQFNTRIVYFWDFDVWERKWIINFGISTIFLCSILCFVLWHWLRLGRIWQTVWCEIIWYSIVVKYQIVF